MEKIRILAVDDTEANLKLLKMSLSRQGHDVITAVNGEEAVKLFKQEKPDLILMDVMMPVMNGFEATKAILQQETDKWLPIIFLSAAATEDHFFQGFEAGGFDYLFKPINQKILKSKIDNAIKIISIQNKLIQENNELKQQIAEYQQAD
ncbi:response regulator [Oceanospirillum sediminis]|uniref:Response regulator n=1 Tax=Oceanospirillum sediminis TaxID=2760088 RepID=A0A839IXK0_9GAMM|nr:response regulator [Oceanospirillum sediminis]MBB1488816.1 response regulator [Oceanospirillum sediminis]